MGKETCRVHQITITFNAPALHEWEQSYLRCLLYEVLRGYLSNRETMSRIAVAEIRAGASVQ